MKILKPIVIIVAILITIIILYIGLNFYILNRLSVHYITPPASDGEKECPGLPKDMRDQCYYNFALKNKYGGDCIYIINEELQHKCIIDANAAKNSNTKVDAEKVPKHPYIKIITSNYSDNFTANYPFFWTTKSENKIFTKEMLDNLSKAVESFVLEQGGKSLKNKTSLSYVTWEMADEHLLSIVFEKREIIENKSLSTLVTMHYDSKTEKYFDLKKIFKPGIEEKLSEIFKDPKYILDKKINNPINGSAISRDELFSQGTSPKIENFSNFLLGETTITFFFAPGQTAEQSNGITSMTVQYNDLKDWFQDNSKELYEKQYTYPALIN